ncbi:NAD(P)H-binding protein [Mycolicibacterium moriokaense]|uniref:Putative NAD(P)-binding protein n=1 Tax=Mycolicibacterium moriokaense TaxID=39691 RepID=A0A318HEH3_9MYCO|nr:NAD(P)H-binding protein [Mycolicibacterium moriokaense]PXX06984.1 putative NAD(P)-binding protein [Mycolicibacterium moriokaense]
MRIVIAGGHGKIALILEGLLSQRGDAVAGFIRNPDHVADVQAAGAEALVVDLENASVDEVATHMRGADAVVFAAGAGPGSGAARKGTVDRDAAILLADAAEVAKVARYVMISAMGADVEAPDDAGNPVFVAYLRAKGAADDNVRARMALESTIVRPGHLTNDPGTGRVTIADYTGRGDVPREDVAAVLLAVLDTPGTACQTFELISGDTAIAEAVTSRGQ